MNFPYEIQKIVEKIPKSTEIHLNSCYRVNP